MCDPPVGTDPCPPVPPTSGGAAWVDAFASAQMQGYCPQCWSNTSAVATSVGQFFWNFKLEPSGYTSSWDYLYGLKNGWFSKQKLYAPSDFDFQCDAWGGLRA